MNKKATAARLHSHRAGRERYRVGENDMTHFGLLRTGDGNQLLGDRHFPGKDDPRNGDGGLEYFAPEPTPVKEQRQAKLQRYSLVVEKFHARRQKDGEEAGEDAKRQQKRLEIAGQSQPERK